ncbi:MAG: hypothetical protein QOE92_677 [Chloroflexota bacterium]|nr:hypothetical protein [Chloroflexota bacterium]
MQEPLLLPIHASRAAMRPTMVALMGIGEVLKTYATHGRRVYHDVAEGRLTAYQAKGRATPLYSTAELDDLYPRRAPKGP